MLVGTAEAKLAWLKKDQLEFIDTFKDVAKADEWYTPWDGPPDTRSLAISNDQKALYADIHVGWINYSYDGGATWSSTDTSKLLMFIKLLHTLLILTLL